MAEATSTNRSSKKQPQLRFVELPMPGRIDGEEETDEQVGLLFSNGFKFRFGNQLASIGHDPFLIGSVLRCVSSGDLISVEDARPLLEGADPKIRAWALDARHRVQPRGSNKGKLFEVVDKAGHSVEKLVEIYRPGYGSAAKGDKRHWVDLPAAALFRGFLDDSGRVSTWTARRGRRGDQRKETYYAFQSVSTTNGMGGIEGKCLVCVIEPKLREQGKKYLLEEMGKVLIFCEADGPPETAFGYVEALWGVFDWFHKEFGVVDFITRMNGLRTKEVAADELVVDDEESTGDSAGATTPAEGGAPASTEAPAAASAASAPAESEAPASDDGKPEGKGKKKGGKAKERKQAAAAERSRKRGGAQPDA